jgi:hypothetical protein
MKEIPREKQRNEQLWHRQKGEGGWIMTLWDHIPDQWWSGVVFSFLANLAKSTYIFTFREPRPLSAYPSPRHSLFSWPRRLDGKHVILNQNLGFHKIWIQTSPVILHWWEETKESTRSAYNHFLYKAGKAGGKLQNQGHQTQN